MKEDGSIKNETCKKKKTLIPNLNKTYRYSSKSAVEKERKVKS